VNRLVPTEKTKTVTYTVAVPKTREESYEVTVYDTVTEDKTETYTVQVPVQVEKTVDVTVCKMVAKTITEEVPVQNGAVAPCAPCK